MTEVGKAIVKSLDNDSSWAQGEYVIENEKLGIRIWTANIPVLNINIWHPKNVPLSFHDKWCIFFAINRRNTKNILEKLSLKDNE